MLYQQEQESDYDEDDCVAFETESNEEQSRLVSSSADVARPFHILKAYCLEKMPDFHQNIFELESQFNSAFMETTFRNATQSNLDSFFAKE